MKGNKMNSIIHLFSPILLGFVAALIIFSALRGKELPLINTPRASLLALLVVGLMMCILGGVGQLGPGGYWFSPAAISGILLGLLILIIILAELVGWKLPMISGESNALAAVGIIISIKFLIGTASFFFHWL